MDPDELAVAWVALPLEWFDGGAGTAGALTDAAPKTMGRWVEREWIVPIRVLAGTETILCRVTHTLDAMPKYVQNAEVDASVATDGKDS